MKLHRPLKINDLIEKLSHIKNGKITVEVDGREYVIDDIKERKNYYDTIAHTCLICRESKVFE